MTNEQILNAIEEYRACFAKFGIHAESYAHDVQMNYQEHPDADLHHCHSMLDKMVEFVAEGKTEKAFRWLGFIQGVLWARGYYTLDQLKDHNR